MSRTWLQVGDEWIEIAPLGVHREGFIPERTPPRRSPWWWRILRWFGWARVGK